MPAYFYRKNIEKIYRNFRKVLDKMLFIWYNIYIKGRADNPNNRRKDTKMTQTNHSWRIATYIIPKGAELVCDNAVRTDSFIFGAALIRYEGQYWLCQNYCLYAVDQGAAEAFAATL